MSQAEQPPKRLRPSPEWLRRWAHFRQRAQLAWAKTRQVLKHLWLDASDTERLVGQEGLSRITAQVAASEQGHTGQVRICIEAALPLSYLWRAGLGGALDGVIRDRALMMFSKLRVWDTAQNNGLLIYVLMAERAIEIVADRGLTERVPTVQWEQLTRQLSSEFGNAHFEHGLADAIDVCSALLMLHFPRPLHPGSDTGSDDLPNEPALQ